MTDEELKKWGIRFPDMNKISVIDGTDIENNPKFRNVVKKIIVKKLKKSNKAYVVDNNLMELMVNETIMFVKKEFPKMYATVIKNAFIEEEFEDGSKELTAYLYFNGEDMKESSIIKYAMPYIMLNVFKLMTVVRKIADKLDSGFAIIANLGDLQQQILIAEQQFVLTFCKCDYEKILHKIKRRE